MSPGVEYVITNSKPSEIDILKKHFMVVVLQNDHV